MKKIILLLLTLSTFSVCSQNFEKEWKEVIKFEVDGKTKSASESVDRIYKMANRKDNNVQIVKCFFYQSKFIQVFEENAQQKIIQNLKAEIASASEANQSLLNYVYALIILQYKNQNSYKISQRTAIDKGVSADFLTWSYTDFENEIEKAFANSLNNER